MKIIHTADLHLGQIIYQHYDRVDEHQHFFAQLKRWCTEEQPDALLVSGDIFDIQQPSAATKKAFNDYFVDLHKACPAMHIVITAGNHDSASRIQAEQAVWQLANTFMVGTSPSLDVLERADGWQEDYIIRLDNGYIIALPFMIGERTEVIQRLINYVAAENVQGKPVVMMGHAAVSGMDPTGHNLEIGKIKTLDADAMGSGYDYLALGHIHKPQTIGYPQDCMKETVTYPSGVIRYSGSALHVSCDEQYPHTVSVVQMDRHGQDVTIRQLRIEELRHFHTLPLDGSSYHNEQDALNGISAFCQDNGKGYIRIRMDYNTALSANFNQQAYDIIDKYDEVRYNAKILWTDVPDKSETNRQQPVFQVAELQQMTDPMNFIEKTIGQYPNLDIEEVRLAFEEVRKELQSMDDNE